MNFDAINQQFAPIMKECKVTVVSHKGEALTFSVSGKICLPHKNGPTWISLSCSVEGSQDEDGSFTIANCSGEVLLETWDLADTLVLMKGRAYLVPVNNEIRVHLKGLVQYTDTGGLAVSGKLDSPIIQDPSDPENVSLFALLLDATLALNADSHLSGGTAWLAISAKSRDDALLVPRPEDTEAEYFFQYGKSLSLGSMSLTGIEPQPITLSVKIEAGPHGKSRLLLTLFPARLRTPLLGAEMILFVHEAHYDEPFTIDTTGRWNAFVSSNFSQQLKSPADPMGPDLMRATASLHGTLSCKGLKADALALDSELTNGIAFPESQWPQPLPYQKIILSVDSRGSASMNLVLQPFQTDAFSILSQAGADAPINASLCPQGLRLENVEVRGTGGETIRHGSMIVDGMCVWQ